MTTALHIVVGAGPLGRALVDVLASRGERVRLVSRRAPTDALPAGVAHVAADVLRPDDARRALAGATVAYQCAQPEYHRWPEEFPALHAAIVRAARDAGATLVLADNLYGYGPHDGPLTEDLPLRATTRKGRVRARLAEEALAMHARGELRVAIGRASDFFGPRVLGSALGDRAFAPLVRGRTANAVGDPDQPHTYTYIEDFARALATLGAREEAHGRAWHVPSAPTVTTRALLEQAFAIAGHRPRVAGTGRLAMRVAGLFIPGARETVEMMYEFERPFVVDHSRYAGTFGADVTPHEEALRRTVAWYRGHGG